MENSLSIALIDSLLFPTAIIAVGIVTYIASVIAVSALSIFTGPKIASLVANYATFPGVIIHELSHALGAVLTGAEVENINFNPQEEDKLGQVSFYTRGNILLRSLQASIVSMAPTVVGITLIFFMSKLYFNNDVLNFLNRYLMVSIFFHLNMSFEDIKLFLKGMIVIIPLTFIIFYFTKINLLDILRQF